MFLEGHADNFFFLFSPSIVFCGLFLVIGLKGACQKMCACCFSDTLPLHVGLEHVIAFLIVFIFLVYFYPASS